MRGATLLLATGLLAACDTQRHARGFEASSPVASEDLRVDAASIWPLDTGTTWWRELEGAEFAWTVSPDPSGGVRSDEGGHRVMVLRASEGGGREVIEVEKPSDDSRTVFDPPLALCPPTLRCGETFVSTSAARVHRIDGGQERDRGTSRRTVEVAGTSVVTCPMLDRGRTWAVRTSLETRLGVAVASVETTRWIHAEHGPVAERTEERIRVFGLPARERIRTVVRLPGPPANPGASAAEAP